jgi:sigma-B regulation protein RsbU (phosphoserine phosphatase)
VPLFRYDPARAAVVNYKTLFSKLERNLDQIERCDDATTTLSAILKRLIDDFQEDLGLRGGRIYKRTEDSFTLQEEYPPTEGRATVEVPASYPPVKEVLQQGFCFFRAGDPGVDPSLEARLGVMTFAAIGVGNDRRHIIAFSLEDRPDIEQVTHTLNTIRHVVNLRLRERYLEHRVAEARSIQLSLLPSSAPDFPEFDIYGRSEPAEEVGGDLYDFIRVSPRLLGLAIADASGHGLPAALQARDSIIGLRMGVEESLRITATVEKLNRVVARSALSSRFISLFYGELEPNGTLVYCNAGHNPPLLWNKNDFEELTIGGIVLGPSLDARYERGYATVLPGATLVAYTDGITEATGAAGEMFGVERLRKIVAGSARLSAQELVDEIFRAVEQFSGAVNPADDQTVVAVRRAG